MLYRGQNSLTNQEFLKNLEIQISVLAWVILNENYEFSINEFLKRVVKHLP